MTVLAATNFPWDLDEALRRRLEKRIYIPLPEPSDIRALLEINLKSLPKDEVRHVARTLAPLPQQPLTSPHHPSLTPCAQDVNLDELANQMKEGGYSGADITNLCRDAAMMPMRRRIKGLNREEIKNLRNSETADLPVSQEDLRMAASRIHSSVSKEDLGRHEAWLQEFGAI